MAGSWGCQDSTPPRFLATPTPWALNRSSAKPPGGTVPATSTPKEDWAGDMGDGHTTEHLAPFSGRADDAAHLGSVDVVQGGQHLKDGGGDGGGE